MTQLWLRHCYVLRKEVDVLSFLFVIVSIIATAALTAQGIFIKQFSDKRPGAEITYTCVSALCAFVLFGIIALTSGSQFNPQSIVYSLLFAVCYAGATVMYVLAIGCGSLAITTTIYSFALIIPTLLGFVIWNEPVNVVKIIGLALFFLSVLLVGEKDDGNGNKMSVKWIVLVCIAFFFEGFAPVAIKLHSTALGEEAASAGNGMFMVLAYAISFVGLLIASLIGERKDKSSEVLVKGNKFFLESIKIALPLASLGGICNGIYNFMTTVVSNKGFNVSVFFPVVSAGQLILTCVLAVTMFKEKLTIKQLFAIGFGAVAIILLNM